VRPRIRPSAPRGAALAAAALAFVAPVAWVQATGHPRVRRSADDVGHADAVVVLGAGLRPDGTASTSLLRRVDAAAELYGRDVAPRVILSGDAHREPDGTAYDEPAVMRDRMLELGVPDDALVLDREGFDTDTTCRRAREVYGVRRAVVVTQRYHLRRTLFGCARAGLDAVGVGVPAPTTRPAAWVWWHVREVLASWKAAAREVARAAGVRRRGAAGACAVRR
jgi:vancomycin permeability regulator SanA